MKKSLWLENTIPQPFDRYELTFGFAGLRRRHNRFLKLNQEHLARRLACAGFWSTFTKILQQYGVFVEFYFEDKLTCLRRKAKEYATQVATTPR